jgi:hypothetical protein
MELASMNKYPRFFWVILSAMVTSTPLYASLEFNGYAKVQQTTFQSRALINHQFDAFSDVFQSVKIMQGGQENNTGALQRSDAAADLPDIVSAPGVVFEKLDSPLDYGFFVKNANGTSRIATESDAVLGSDILIYANNIINHNNLFPNKVDRQSDKTHLIANAENDDVTENSITFDKSLNQNIVAYFDYFKDDTNPPLFTDNDDNTVAGLIAVNYPSNEGITDDNFKYPATITAPNVNSAGVISYTVNTAVKAGNNNRFFPLVQADQSTKFFISQSSDMPSKIQMNSVLKDSVSLIEGNHSPFSYTDIDTTEYLEASLGIISTFHLNSGAKLSFDLGFSAPLESLEHQGFYHQIDPQFSIHSMLLFNLDMGLSSISLGHGLRLDQYSSVTQTLETTATAVETVTNTNSLVRRTFEQDIFTLMQFSEITAAFKIYEDVSMTLGYSVSELNQQFELKGLSSNDKASIQFESYSIGLRSSFTDRMLM